MAWIRSGRKGLATRGAALLVTAVLASACVSSGEQPSLATGEGEESAKTSQAVLSWGQAQQALLSLDNLGDDFIMNPAGAHSWAPASGCLSVLEVTDSQEASVEAAIDYVYLGGTARASIYNSVASFEQAAEITGAFDEVRAALESCRQVDITNEQGFRLQLDAEVEDRETTTHADDQINILVSGTQAYNGVAEPLRIAMSLVRVDNNTTTVSIRGGGGLGWEQLHGYTEIAVDRLVAVAAGQSPPEVLAAPFAHSYEPVEAPPAPQKGFDPQPLDGGSYTWASGVQLRLSIERVEPWGRMGVFCEFDPCVVAKPDDTRFVFKYEVTVPEDFPSPLLIYECPGPLLAATGNDGNAFARVPGEYQRDLRETILPGSTRFGVEEYYIERAYVDEEFFIESTCGDVNYSGETAHFVGKIEFGPESPS